MNGLMLDLPRADLDALWASVTEVARAHAARLARGRAAPQLDGPRVRELVSRCRFETPMAPAEAVEFVSEAMYEHHVHPPHPRYFGLFNPAATQAGAAGDALAAVFNPNVAAWSHSPFAVEVERHLARRLGERMGLPPNLEGVFTAGGAEANHTALLAALFRRWPEARTGGLRVLRAQPTLYVSEESHHSFVKAARASGLGSDAVRHVPTDEALRLVPEELERVMREDADEGFEPFLVVSTAGTTNSGAIDPIANVAEVAADMSVWHHTDAAWAGAVALLPEHRLLLDGFERADSVTVDVHKWLSAPMGAGLFLTRHEGALLHAFEVANEYMPHEAAQGDSYDLYQRSLQWSRRFYGLKVFLSLLIHGWEGYEGAIREMMATGGYLRESLAAAGWRLLNDTELPIACFADARRPDGSSADYLEAVREAAFRAGDVWISTTRLKKEIPALRACITNWSTRRSDIDALLVALEQARTAGDLGELPE
jgi:glutamate/tyrosine decarboxylase-like PLP-dependent enzyme